MKEFKINADNSGTKVILLAIFPKYFYAPSDSLYFDDILLISCLTFTFYKI